MKKVKAINLIFEKPPITLKNSVFTIEIFEKSKTKTKDDVVKISRVPNSKRNKYESCQINATIKQRTTGNKLP